jgi:ankyrin repeat protein
MLQMNRIFEDVKNYLDPDRKNKFLSQDYINNNVQGVKSLIAKGINVNYLYLGNAPLHLSAMQNHTEIIKLLIQAGADVNIQIQSTDDKINGSTPLHLACEKGYVESAKLLIQEGAALIEINDKYSQAIKDLLIGSFVYPRICR